jgi:hypothetical protein
MKIVRKIREEVVANHANDIVFATGREVFVVNKVSNVMARFNSHKDYLRDNAVEYTTTKEEFLNAMENVWEAFENDKVAVKFNPSNIKRKLSLDCIIEDMQ